MIYQKLPNANDLPPNRMARGQTLPEKSADAVRVKPE